MNYQQLIIKIYGSSTHSSIGTIITAIRRMFANPITVDVMKSKVVVVVLTFMMLVIVACSNESNQLDGNKQSAAVFLK